jgi:hypothetical protein
MFGKNDSVDNLSRNLDHAREKRDALASNVTALTAQIAEIEARLSEEKNRRERDRVLGEIYAAKKRIKQTVSALAPLIVKLCEATEMAAAIVPEARTLDSFLLSVATEIDNVIDPLLRELDRRADEVRVGHAVVDLPCLANAAPTELPKDPSDPKELRSVLRLRVKALPLFGDLLRRILHDKGADETGAPSCVRTQL